MRRALVLAALLNAFVVGPVLPLGVSGATAGERLAVFEFYAYG